MGGDRQRCVLVMKVLRQRGGQGKGGYDLQSVRRLESSGRLSSAGAARARGELETALRTSREVAIQSHLSTISPFHNLTFPR